MPLPLDSGVEGRVLRGGILRTPSGPEGSSGKQTIFRAPQASPA